MEAIFQMSRILKQQLLPATCIKHNNGLYKYYIFFLFIFFSPLMLTFFLKSFINKTIQQLLIRTSQLNTGDSLLLLELL